MRKLTDLISIKLFPFLLNNFGRALGYDDADHGIISTLINVTTPASNITNCQINSTTATGWTTNGTAVSTSQQVLIQNSTGGNQWNFQPNGQLIFQDGTAALPSLAAAGYPTYGIYMDTAHGLAFSHNGGEIAYFTTNTLNVNGQVSSTTVAATNITATGNIGIGTTTPTSSLTVLTGNLNGITVNSTQSGYYRLLSAASTFAIVNRYDNDNDIEFLTGVSGATPSTVQMAINTSSGFIGIGTITPSQKLTVSGSANISTKLYMPGIPGSGAFICFNSTDASLYRLASASCT